MGFENKQICENLENVFVSPEQPPRPPYTNTDFETQELNRVIVLQVFGLQEGGWGMGEISIIDTLSFFFFYFGFSSLALSDPL